MQTVWKEACNGKETAVTPKETLPFCFKEGGYPTLAYPKLPSLRADWSEPATENGGIPALARVFRACLIRRLLSSVPGDGLSSSGPPQHLSVSLALFRKVEASLWSGGFFCADLLPAPLNFRMHHQGFPPVNFQLHKFCFLPASKWYHSLILFLSYFPLVPRVFKVPFLSQEMVRFCRLKNLTSLSYGSAKISLNEVYVAKKSEVNYLHSYFPLYFTITNLRCNPNRVIPVVAPVPNLLL